MSILTNLHNLIEKGKKKNIIMSTTIVNPSPSPTGLPPIGNPVNIVTTPVSAPVETTAQKILGDMFLAGTLAVSMFVKNPASQARATALTNALSALLAQIEEQW